jgi:hypothetical protein
LALKGPRPGPLDDGDSRRAPVEPAGTLDDSTQVNGAPHGCADRPAARATETQPKARMIRSATIDTDATQRFRRRLNAAVLVLPAQWLSLMAVFWLRFLPPLRPFEFDVPAPNLAVWAVTCAACFFPLLFPARWFAPHPVERRVYRLLGVRLFRLLAPDGDLVNRRLRHYHPGYRVLSSRTELRDHLIGSYVSERSHLVLFLMGVCTQAFAWRTGQIAWAVVLTVGNVIFNLYPVLHQRHKRARAPRAHGLVVNA